MMCVLAVSEAAERDLNHVSPLVSACVQVFPSLLRNGFVRFQVHLFSVWMSTLKYLCVFVHMSLYVHFVLCACLHVDVCLLVHLCKYTYAYIYIYICIYICAC